MADTRGTNEAFELVKQQAREALLQHALNFFGNDDARINGCMVRLFEAITAEVERNPRVVFAGSSGSDSNIRAVLNALKDQPSDISGSDDITGGDLLSDIADFINAIKDFINGEKKIFMMILLLVFCGDDACHCICECICK